MPQNSGVDVNVEHINGTAANPDPAFLNGFVFNCTYLIGK